MLPTLTYKYSETLNFLYSLNRKGIKLGLEHTHQLLKHLGNPHKKLKIIHVAGTNGKGSTCAHIESVLRYNGYKVGVYTSPHLIKFNERIRINGRLISNQEIISFMDNAISQIKKIESTFFETTTAMAFDYFNKKKVDFAIIETGLGGRLDSTNVTNPFLTIITSISYDHTEILGETIEEIASEKAGIIKEGCPLIISRQSKRVLDIIKTQVLHKNTFMIVSDKPKNIKIDPSGTSFTYNKMDYKTSLIGEYQAENSALAITAINNINSKITYESISQGFKNVFWLGRMQKVSEYIFYDVGHNYDGIKKTIGVINKLYPNFNIIGLFCIKKDKELEKISILLNKFKMLYICQDKNNYLMSHKTLSKKLDFFKINNTLVNSVKHGSKKLQQSINHNTIGLIFGSHYIASEVFNVFEISFD